MVRINRKLSVVCACVRVCMFSYNTYVFYACMYACNCACMHACMLVCMYVHTYVCTHACTHVCVCLYVSTYVHVRTHARTQIPSAKGVGKVHGLEGRRAWNRLSSTS
jgi:dolichyl-phosphate-mannose--protein O-mannosyl transferase